MPRKFTQEEKALAYKKVLERTKQQKIKILARVKASNEAVANGLPPDPWVILYRKRNNAQAAKWRAKQPKKERIIKEPKPKKKKVRQKKGRPFLSPEYRLAQKEKWRQNTKKWHKENRERVNERKRMLRNNNPSFKIACNLRKRLSYLVRRHSTRKTKQTLVLLACPMDFFLAYLSERFQPGMSFDNYGLWHIDHIRPCDSFDLTKVEEQEKCFHYTNLQPLWARDNIVKSNKLLVA